MSRYNQYGTYYDPVGSQASQPAGYTYQTSSSSSAYPSAATSSAYGSTHQGCGGNNHAQQQYSSSAHQQQQSNSASHAAAALSSLSGQNYSQTSTSGNRAGSSDRYDTSSYLSTLGRIGVPEQTQNGSSTFQAYRNAPSSAGASGQSYQSSYPQPQTQLPRYNSPLHAVQAQQHGHNKQTSRSSNHAPSPQIAQAIPGNQQRQQSASVEPSPTTVDPSQVYDNRAELQRKAQVEAEKRRKYEAEQAKKRAEEEAQAEERRKADEERQRAEKEMVMKKAETQRNNEQRRKAREEKKQSKNAATTLQQMASGFGTDGAASPTNDEEAEMRAMFQKMREFNAKNPGYACEVVG